MCASLHTRDWLIKVMRSNNIKSTSKPVHKTVYSLIFLIVKKLSTSEKGPIRHIQCALYNSGGVTQKLPAYADPVKARKSIWGQKKENWKMLISHIEDCIQL